MKFPRQMYDAIVHERENDRAVSVASLPNKIKELTGKERTLNDMFWELWEKGKCENRILSDYFRDERNAVRLRILRMQRRLQKERT